MKERAWMEGREGAAVSRDELSDWILKGGGVAATAGSFSLLTWAFFEVCKALLKETSDVRGSWSVAVVETEVLATSVREVFNRFDQSGDGKLDMRELWRVFKSLDGRLRLRDLAALSSGPRICDALSVKVRSWTLAEMALRLGMVMIHDYVELNE